MILFLFFFRISSKSFHSFSEIKIVILHFVVLLFEEVFLMPLKSTKKLISKKKQNGKKVIKGQGPKTKQRYEMESSPKEQILELDKEILTIKICESESKLTRRNQLCCYMEEEISIYKTLYNEKQLIKSESMKLLNFAFEDFATEICLLEQELDAMQHVLNEIRRKENVSFSHVQKVRLLRTLEAKLGENLFESEICHKECMEFNKVFIELKVKATSEKKNFKFAKEEILKDFENNLFRIQNGLIGQTDVTIEDDSLKLDLLPLPYKTLFLSGWFSDAWLDSVATSYKCMLDQNFEVGTKVNDLFGVSTKNAEVIKKFSSDNLVLPGNSFQVGEGRRRKDSLLDSLKFLKLNQEIHYLESKCEHLKCKLQSQKSEISDLETAVQSLEDSGETYFEKSYLVQVVNKASSILKQEL